MEPEDSPTTASPAKNSPSPHPSDVTQRVCSGPLLFGEGVDVKQERAREPAGHLRYGLSRVFSPWRLLIRLSGYIHNTSSDSSLYFLSDLMRVTLAHQALMMR